MGRHPWVGREQELQGLLERAETLESRRGERLLITGPPGMGKRTLLDRFLSLLPSPYLWARASVRAPEPLAALWLHELLQALGPGARGLQRTLTAAPEDPWPRLETALQHLARHTPVVLVAEGMPTPGEARTLQRLTERLRGLPLFWILATPAVPPPLGLWPHLSLPPLRLQHLHQWLLEETGVPQTPEFLVWLGRMSGGIPGQVRAILDLIQAQGLPLHGTVLEARAVDLAPLIARERERLRALPPRLQQILACLWTPRRPEDLKELSASDLQTLLEQGVVVELRGRLHLASGLLQEALQQENPGAPEARTPLDRISETLERLATHLHTGDLERARSLVATLARDPTERRLLEAQIRVAEGRLEDAFHLLLEVYRDATDGSDLRAWASLSLGRVCYGMGHLNQCRHFLEEAEYNARAAGTSEVLLRTRSLQSAVMGTEGHLQEAEEGWWQLLGQAAGERTLPLDPLSLLFFRGHYLLHYHSLRQRRPRHREEWALNRAGLAETLLEMHRLEQARLFLEEAWPDLQQYPLWQPVGERLWAQLLVLEGEPEQAVPWLDRALVHYTRMKGFTGLIKTFALRAEVRLRQGQGNGTEDLELALRKAAERRHLLMIPYLLERGLRGLAWMRRPPREMTTNLVQRYLESVRRFRAEARIPWFLKSLPAGSQVEKRLTQQGTEPLRARIRLQLLGPFQVLFPSLEVRVHTGSAKARQLLATLALAPTRQIAPTPRFLARALWPDLSPDRQIHNLHWTFSHLRKFLGREALIRRNDQYLLNPEVLEVDLWVFLERLQRAREAERQGLRALATHRYEEALDLVQGEPFQEVVYPAIEPQVQDLRRQILQGFARVARFYLNAYRPDQALLVASRGLTLSPDDPELQHLLTQARHP